MKSNRGDIYTVVVLGGKKMGDDLNDCLIVTCTNMRSLAGITGIAYDRLVYVFTRKSKRVLEEKDCYIIKSNSLYRGRQQGGIRNKQLLGFNR